MITLKTLLAATSILALTVGGAAAAPKPRQAPFQEPFSVIMMLGDPEQVVATKGPLEVVARCIPNGAQAALQILVRSSVDDWAITSTVQSPDTGSVNLPAGEQVWYQISNANPEFAAHAREEAAIAPDGSFLSVRAAAGGVNVFGSDCLAAGVVTDFRVPLVP